MRVVLLSFAALVLPHLIHAIPTKPVTTESRGKTGGIEVSHEQSGLDPDVVSGSLRASRNPDKGKWGPVTQEAENAELKPRSNDINLVSGVMLETLPVSGDGFRLIGVTYPEFWEEAEQHTQIYSIQRDKYYSLSIWADGYIEMVRSGSSNIFADGPILRTNSMHFTWNLSPEELESFGAIGFTLRFRNPGNTFLTYFYEYDWPLPTLGYVGPPEELVRDGKRSVDPADSADVETRAEVRGSGLQERGVEFDGSSVYTWAWWSPPDRGPGSRLTAGTGPFLTSVDIVETGWWEVRPGRYYTLLARSSVPIVKAQAQTSDRPSIYGQNFAHQQQIIIHFSPQDIGDDPKKLRFWLLLDQPSAEVAVYLYEEDWPSAEGTENLDYRRLIPVSSPVDGTTNGGAAVPPRIVSRPPELGGPPRTTTSPTQKSSRIANVKIQIHRPSPESSTSEEEDSGERP